LAASYGEGSYDADEISTVILRALRETSAKDYTEKIIEMVERSFNRSAVL
jgi:hypothetical protein